MAHVPKMSSSWSYVLRPQFIPGTKTSGFQERKRRVCVRAVLPTQPNSRPHRRLTAATYHQPRQRCCGGQPVQRRLGAPSSPRLRSVRYGILRAPLVSVRMLDLNVRFTKTGKGVGRLLDNSCKKHEMKPIISRSTTSNDDSSFSLLLIYMLKTRIIRAL